MRRTSRMMMLLWIGLFAMASMTSPATWTYAAGLLAAAAVLPLVAAAGGPAKAPPRRFEPRRAPITVVWQNETAPRGRRRLAS